jgi:hypothetical protein
VRRAAEVVEGLGVLDVEGIEAAAVPLGASYGYTAAGPSLSHLVRRLVAGSSSARWALLKSASEDDTDT